MFARIAVLHIARLPELGIFQSVMIVRTLTAPNPSLNASDNPKPCCFTLPMLRTTPAVVGAMTVASLGQLVNESFEE